ncbi:MFS transporter [Streptomyces erythrochromogenes]|uniref:MFS transporter n=1 Tax=Streptomyces erythrochromogenes TaxID=285574 RepID=UPI003434F746
MTRISSRTAGPIFMSFLAMGFADALTPFVSLGRDQFHLSYLAAQLIPFTGFAMFGLLSIPTGVLQARIGRVRVLSIGLIAMLAAVAIPMVLGLHSFSLFLATTLLLGVGATLLQVSTGPLLQDACEPGKFPQRVLTAHCLHGVGSLTGPLIPALAALALGAGWHVVFPVYAAALALTLTAVRLAGPRNSRPAAGYDNRPTIRSPLALLKKRDVAVAAGMLFAYMGAEITVGSQIPLLLHSAFGYDTVRTGMLGAASFVAALAGGRLLGQRLLRHMSPSTLLRVSCLTGVLGLAVAFVPVALVAAAGFVLAGLGFANVFPLIYAATLNRTPAQHTDAVSSILLTTVCGGALIPLLAGLVADTTNDIHNTLLIPLAIFIALAVRTFRPEQPGDPRRTGEGTTPIPVLTEDRPATASAGSRHSPGPAGGQDRRSGSHGVSAAAGRSRSPRCAGSPPLTRQAKRECAVQRRQSDRNER